SSGEGIVLGTLSYPKGLGVLADSAIDIALNGQSARFAATIGVDGRTNSGSSVVFAVYGDGRLLYQSPTMTFASGGVPIDLDVTGVGALQLVVSPAAGSTPASDHAVWAAARLISTGNFAGTTPYTLTWQLASNGKLFSARKTGSYIFGRATDGVFTLSLTVTDGSKHTATRSTTITVGPPRPSWLQA